MALLFYEHLGLVLVGGILKIPGRVSKTGVLIIETQLKGIKQDKSIVFFSQQIFVGLHGQHGFEFIRCEFSPVSRLDAIGLDVCFLVGWVICVFFDSWVFVHPFYCV